MTGVFLSADLVNRAAAANPWTPGTAEQVLRTHQIRRPALTARTADELRDWAVRLRTAFEADGVEARCATVNSLLSEGTTRAYLTTHDRLGPHLHFAADDDNVVARVRAVTAGSLAIFVVEAGGSRLGVCARDSCATVFVDTSRNGRRSYCSARCGNNDAVLRHRAKTAPHVRTSTGGR